MLEQAQPSAEIIDFQAHRPDSVAVNARDRTLRLIALLRLALQRLEQSITAESTRRRSAYLDCADAGTGEIIDLTAWWFPETFDDPPPRGVNWGEWQRPDWHEWHQGIASGRP